MSPKRQGILCHKLIALSLLLVENLDELSPDSAEVLKYKEDLTGFIEKLTDEIGDSNTMHESTYFQDLCNKVDTVLRKNFNPDM